MSKFYNKTTIDSEWGAMLSSAQAYFDTFSQKKLKFNQCVVLRTDKGEQIIFPFNSDSIDGLKKQASSNIVSFTERHKNDVVKKIICMWENQTIDVPSSEFMNKICRLNKENENAIVLLSAGTDAYLTKKIVDII